MLRDYCLITGSDGSLATTPGGELSTPEEVESLVNRLSTAKKVVLHIHGGLVSASHALDGAERVLPEYLNAGIFPVFIIWKTGPLETLENMLQSLFPEDLFSIMVRRVSGFVARKMGSSDFLGG